MKNPVSILLILLIQACQTTAPFTKTVPSVDIERYMGKWYVIATRPTIFEKDAYSATETYEYNPATERIDIDFRYRKGSFTGKEKSIGQRGRIYNKNSNAHWKIGLKWLPFEFDYLIIGLDPAYEWTVVGVPSQKYVWIMSRQSQMNSEQLSQILKELESIGYSTANIELIPQQSNEPSSQK